MSKHTTLIVFAIGCTHSTTQMLPGESDNNDGVALRIENNPCSGTSDFESDGVVDVNWTYFYDGLGRSTKDVGKYTANPDMPDDLYTYAWDNADHLTAMIETSNGAEVWKYESNYDTLGDQLDITYTDSYDPTMVSVDRTENHDFDDHGHPTYAIQTVTGSGPSKITFAYDALGRLVERDTDFGSDGSVESMASTVYDDAARNSTTTTTNSGSGIHSVRVRQYDDSLHLLSIHRETFTPEGKRTTFDVDYTWDGDRVLSFAVASNGTQTSIDRYNYSCSN